MRCSFAQFTEKGSDFLLVCGGIFFILVGSCFTFTFDGRGFEFLELLSSFLYLRWRPELKDSEDFELDDVESESEIEDSDEEEERSEDEESDGGGEGGLSG